MSEEKSFAQGAGPSLRVVPEGDDRERLVCPDCGFIDYQNPRVIVGSVATWGERILLVKRAIQPRRGFWTLPAGFLEHGESPAEGALREAREEACAELELDQLLAVYSIPRIGQVQLMYRARLVAPDVAAGDESEAVDLFAWDDIPWDEIAFPSVRWALGHWRETRGETAFAPRVNPPGETGDMRRG
jgi:ADP-ribose pyrophosphatase YjhB (NUDIX family)